MVNIVNLVIVWSLIILFIIQPGVAHEGAVQGAYLFVKALLPYLLPYIILTQWLLKLPPTAKKNSKWRHFIKAYILGSFGGFPVGAVTVSEMAKKGELSNHQSSWILASCHAPGPMFIIGFIGAELFSNVHSGWKLLIAIHLANILFFLMTLLFLNKQANINKNPQLLASKSSGIPLLNAVKESSNVIILVATTVIFFSSLGAVLTNVITTFFTVDTGITQTAILSLFEMTTGVQSAVDHFNHFTFFPFLVAAIISLNGLSIHLQVTVIAKAANISLKPYLLGRLWSIVVVPLIFYLLL